MRRKRPDPAVFEYNEPEAYAKELVFKSIYDQEGGRYERKTSDPTKSSGVEEVRIGKFLKK